MKKAGIVGGLGAESTLEYYRQIVYRYHEEAGCFPQIVIDSVDLDRSTALLTRRAFDEYVGFLLRAVRNVAKAGADFGVIASNTPHIVFEPLKDQSPIPLISIVEETLKAVRLSGQRKVGLLGTKFTMDADFYKNLFKKDQIEIIVPDEVDRQFIQKKIFEELEYGIVRAETKERFLAIINKMEENDHVQAVILGCTELPLIIKKDDTELPLFDTAKIHIDSILKKMES
ncbi:MULTISPECIES: aspartate/glutamate racemase family protein [unclassified Sporolactobacillus]|uniref:aspartate/glutamate racemase family protein n=1 Tax=unclassified Sporolactobacillus TaxID=2628533 RepID=UPI002368F14C|nr:amino acid racemase [Sporolactobacillus sp. CQH2019]MDD9147483.1 amino acid racemase [Sporolactobacillus sp. CQH2019]